MWVHLWEYHIVKYGVEARDKGALEDPGSHPHCDTIKGLIWKYKSLGCIQLQMDLCPLLKCIKLLEPLFGEGTSTSHCLAIAYPSPKKWVQAPEEGAGPIIPNLQL